MQSLSCSIKMDGSNRELNLKGTQEFPLAIYNDNLSKEKVPHHWHEEIELIVVVKGKAKITVEHETVVVKEKEGIFINSGRLHSCEDYEKENCCIKSFVLHPRFVYGEQNSVLYQNYFHTFLQQTSANKQALCEKESANVLLAYNTFTKESFAFEFKVREILTDVLLSVINKSKGTAINANSKSLKQLSRCKKMMLFIHDNYAREVTLEEIAKSAQIKQSEALRCFKAVINTSPIKYLKNYRLKQAALMLKTTTASVIDIAFSCGFSEISYFSKSFKEVYNCTPTQYRNTHFISNKL